MKIEFDEMSETLIPKFKGGTGELFLKKYEEDKIKIMRSRLTAGSFIGRHKHTDDCEIIYIVSGEAEAFCDGKKETLFKGAAHYCPRCSEHSIVNTGKTDLEMFAVVIKS